LHITGKQVYTVSLVEFLQYGIRFVFPQRPGPVVRGVPTAHSVPPLNTIIRSEESYVWPSARGTVRGHSITPLYKSAVDAVKIDEKLHIYLALVDALRVGKAREKGIAIAELKERILDEV
jgi:hypothetical protein